MTAYLVTADDALKKLLTSLEGQTLFCTGDKWYVLYTILDICAS